MDWRVLGFTLAASVLTGLLFGLAPVFHLTRFGVHDAMKESSHGAGGSVHRSRLRHALIVAEVALSVVLLAGEGLLFRSFLQLQSVNAGFTPEQVLTARLSPSGEKFKTDSDYIKYYENVLARIGALPGVREAGVINTLPLQKGPTFRFRVEGRAPLPIDKWPPANYRSVSPNYFHVLNIPVLQGRPFTDRDNEQAPTVLLVNQSIAEKYFPGENAVGKRINFGRTDSNQQPIWREIVGVVADVKNMELKEQPEPEIYFSSLQSPFEAMSIVIRSSVEPGSLAGAVRGAVAEVDKTVPVADIETMDRIITESVMQPRFNMVLLGLFSAIALMLSAAGIYGVTSYTVTQRTHELGIRLALGAQLGDVLRLILKQGLAVILIGVAIGLAAAFVLTRLLRTLVFGISTNDPVTFIGITLLLSLVALIACYVPARRATKVDPLVALRYE
jgi:putative ABC transport system permease protein